MEKNNSNNWAVLVLLILGVVIVLSVLLGCAGCKPAEPPSYPRRALAMNSAHRLPDSVLTRYSVIYGYQEASRVAAMRNKLPVSVNERTRWFATINPTCTYEHQPPDWVYDLARDNLMDALHVAVYENGLRGADWFLRDADGNTIGKWTDDNQWRALNWTAYCPKGVWGETAGLTCLDYLVGPLLDLATEGAAGDAFDGYIMEDGPDKHLWCYNWDGCVTLANRCVDRAGYIAAADSCRQRFLDEFVVEAGRRGFIMLTNGHYVLETCASHDPPMWAAFSGAKLERFGDWGGCPYDDIDRWWEVYRGVEDNYGPIHTIGRADGLQGWDVSLCQIELEAFASMQSVRLLAALCLMGDAAFSVSPYHNHHGGEPDSIPPELDIPLGNALGAYKETNDGLLYRDFKYGRVTVNITDKPIGKVPAKDAVWEVVK